MNVVPTDSELDWVLVLAPFRKDADYIGVFLREHNIEVKSSSTGDDLEPLLSTAPGIIIISHEALNPAVVAAIAAHLAEQPDLSEVPIMILL